MAFSERVKDDAFERSEGRCECKRSSHTNHTGHCPATITRHGAKYHHTVSVKAGGPDTLSNCEALCPLCHTQTKTFGG